MMLWIFLFLLSVYSIVITYYCLRFAMTVLRIQDSLQVSLDVIEEKYSKISEILSRPLFFDSPEVRQVLKDIELTRDALENVAYDLSNKIENESLEEKIIDEG